MDSEWQFIQRHRNAILTFIAGCLMYAVIYAGYIDRTSLRYDEVWIFNHDTIFLAAGRWCGFLFRALLGHGPCYPIVGIMGGLLLNAAILLQLKLCGMHRLWQMLTFTTLYLCSVGWCDNLQYSTMSDFFAASVLLTTLAVHLQAKAGRRHSAAAVLCLTLAFGCFQSSALCYIALVMLLVLRAALDGDAAAVRKLILRSMALAAVALVAFYACHAVARRFAPADMLHIARIYQGSMVGWRDVIHMPAAEAWAYILKLAIKAPLACMFGVSGDLGQWLYATVWLPVGLLVYRTARAHGKAKAALAAVFCALLVYVPFFFSAVLLNKKGVLPYMCMAQPMVLCGLWSVGILSHEGFCRRFRTLLVVFLLAAFVKNSYAVNVAARNDRYFYDMARHEMREMYLLSRVEAQKAGVQDAPYLVVGTIPSPKEPCEIDKDVCRNTALPQLLFAANRVNAHADFLRLSKMRSATDAEVAAHAQALSQMPVWPAIGSVKADGDAVLIKINEPVPAGE